MKLQTEVNITGIDFKISYPDRMMTLGSCFAENVSARLEQAGFQLDTNPFGIMYNPLSIARGIKELLACKQYTATDIFNYQGVYSSFLHHSRFSDVSADVFLERINHRMVNSSAFLEKASVLFITFGTSTVYKLKKDKSIVSNCHKLPTDMFDMEALEVEEIVSVWTYLIAELKKKNPELQLVFTISPIRHWKDGAHQNQVSKAKLLIAVDQLVKRMQNCYYFPSYEIMMDELRDYRFYADDMLHPSDLAVDYIWEKFSAVFFEKETVVLIKEWKDIQRALNHLPFNPESEEYKLFKKKTEQRLNDFLSRLE